MSESEPAIKPEQIAAAESLLGLEFSAEQREQMRKVLSDRLEHYGVIRANRLDNGVPLSLQFNVNAADPAPAPVPRSYAMSAGPPVTRPADLEDAAFYPVTQLAELLRTRQVTSLELTEMYLSRLKRYDPVLQCVAAYTDDLAIQQAKRADAEIARGLYRGPLHGLPWGAKDLLATRGYPTGWGAKPYEGQQIDLDATVVRRLEEAGAVLIAKLTLGALANGDVWYGGTTKNPWDTSEGSSGSSAGPGAATAAGLVAYSIGTETMGSIVSPSTRCGVSGLRPTYGRVSRYGAMALSWSMDKIGPMCRSVEDCALVFSAIYGPDGCVTCRSRPSPSAGIRPSIHMPCASAMSPTPSKRPMPARRKTRIIVPALRRCSAPTRSTAPLSSMSCARLALTCSGSNCRTPIPAASG